MPTCFDELIKARNVGVLQLLEQNALPMQVVKHIVVFDRRLVDDFDSYPHPYSSTVVMDKL